jgi:hypothetical protein
MPILNRPLDQNRHARVDLVLFPAQPRRTALQTAAGLSLPPPQALAGMLDTGATITVIDPQVRQALNLVPFRIQSVSVPSAPAPVNVLTYKIDLAIVDSAGQFWLLYPMLSVLETPLIHTGVPVLVGCDVLSKCLFSHNGSGSTFTLAY